MAQLERIERALRNADAAGDVEAARALAAEWRRLKSEASNDDGTPTYKGLAPNAAAGANEAIYKTIGAPVDLARGAINLGIRGANAVTGAEVDLIPSDSFGGSEWIGDRMGDVHPILDSDNVVATTTGERIARGVGEGLGYTIAPQAAARAAVQSGVVRGGASRVMEGLVGTGRNPVRDPIVGMAAGGGAVAGMEAAPENLKPLAGIAGGLAAGGAAAIGTSAGQVAGAAAMGAGRRVAAPLTKSGREQLAADQLAEGATNRYAAEEALETTPGTILEGSDPTTFQQTGDMGLGAMERGAQARRPDLFNARVSDQNAARLGAVEGLQKEGAPEAVATAVRQRLADLDADARKTVEDAVQRAREAADASGQPMTPEDSGAVVRQALETARAAAKAKERELWQAVDPDGSLSLSADNAKGAAKTVRDELPKSARGMSGEEDAIFKVLDRYEEVVPFSELTALSSRLKAEMRAEMVANGESPAHRRMSILNGALEADLDAAIALKAADEASAVKAGELSFEETLAGRIQAQDARFSTSAETVARVGSQGSYGGYASRTAPPVPGSSGAAREAGSRPRNAEGGARISADAGEPTFDGAARERLSAARQATRDRVETFDNRQLRPIRERQSQTTPDAAVPAKVFVPGPKGYQAVQTYRKAVGDEEAFRALEGYVVDQLRTKALRPDGTMDPAKVRTFRSIHKDALRAFPELDGRFANAQSSSEALSEITKSAGEAASAARQGVVKQVAELEDPEAVSRAVGGVFAKQYSAQEMLKLRQSIKGDKAALQGLRKSVVDYMLDRFISNTEAGTSGRGMLKSDQFQTFIRRNEKALINAGFKGDEIELMRRVASDLQRANRSNASVKNAGSNTAQDQIAAGSDRGSLLYQVLGQVGAPVGTTLAAGAAGGLWGGVAGAGGAIALTVLRKQGLEKADDIVRDALLNPERARILLRKATTPKEQEAFKLALERSFKRSPAATAIVAAEELGDNLTPSDRASPIPPDVLSKGKRVMDAAQR
ncbi:MAG: hypothetical protein AAF311_14325 [Pseudomonadota bacterium]